MSPGESWQFFTTADVLQMSRPETYQVHFFFLLACVTQQICSQFNVCSFLHRLHGARASAAFHTHRHDLKDSVYSLNICLQQYAHKMPNMCLLWASCGSKLPFCKQQRTLTSGSVKFMDDMMH